MRNRESIKADSLSVHEDAGADAYHGIKLHLILEVLLDIRDLLKEDKK